jgi:hypothetical protein
MVSEREAASAVTNTPPEVAAGIPAVEVDPKNELLDGENLAEKAALLADPVANVKVDPSGTRLESKDAGRLREAGEVVPNLVEPPPASANLEVRKRTVKTVDAYYGSIGAGETGPDSMLEALKAEREGLQRRADDGDERAGKRVSQVDESIKAREQVVQAGQATREQAAQARESAAAAVRGDGGPQAEAEARTEPPKERTSRPTTSAGKSSS